MAYYWEINLVAISIALILLVQGRHISSKNETSQLIMNIMLGILIWLSASDILAYCMRGRSYWGVEIANVLYFVAMAAGTFVWLLFIMTKVNVMNTRKRMWTLWVVPFVILTIVCILNPITNFMFTVDEQLLYHRGPGVYLTWAIEWGYLFVAIGINVRGIIREKRSIRRREYQGYLLYVLPMVVTAVCQMMFYGTTTTQVGYALALLLAYLNMQFFQVQRDELTGVNNKNAFLSYQDFILSRNTPTELRLIMIDADGFKQINDKLGHLVGDQALCDIADVLKGSLEEIDKNNAALYRYGGDEFVIIGKNMGEEETLHLQNTIEKRLAAMNERNKKAGKSYVLALSMGSSAQICESHADFDHLIKRADDAMYQEKKAKKAAR